MARDIDPAVQTLLETQLGQEIIVVLEIFWTERQDVSIQTFPPPAGATERKWYADREIAGAPEVKSNILQMSDVDAAVQVSKGGQSKSVRVILDDTDGEMKAIFDVNDMHKKPCRVWFYVNGTDFATEKFPIFLGQINTPVRWSEGDRTFEFEVVNRIEDVEVGFSYEEGSANEVPEELIGKPFPLCFGTTINVPALKAVPSISGTLAGGVGIKDFTLGNRINLAEAITCPQTPIGYKCSGAYPNFVCRIAYETDASCTQARCLELELLKLQHEEQSSYEYSSIIIIGGERFPQDDRITLNINGGLFTGRFDGTDTDPSNVFLITSRQHPRYNPATGGVYTDPVQAELDSRCPGSLTDGQDSNYVDSIHGPLWTGLRNSRLSWEAYREAARADFFWAQGGSTVSLENNREITYIANIVPSTIHNVKAVRFLNGNEFLVDVPDEFYEVRQVDYGGYQVMEIVFQRPLSVESQGSGGGWRDDIYITQTSTVGPNTVDILEWFINTYTDYEIDSTSFDDVKAKIEVYPMHFPLLTRPNLLTVLQQIARQARCALWQRDDKFFIKYLPEEPTPVDTITQAEILRESETEEGRGTLAIELTPTEDLVTKSVNRWRKDFSPFIEKDNTLILRHNIKRYGTHDEEVDYYTYAHLDLVRKSATFWLIREANTWKRLTMTVPLQYAALEPFDAVTVDLADVSGETFLAVVERAVLDSSGKEIRLELWTPVRAGEMTPYNFAFPAQISENALFPDAEARNESDAGSGNEPNFSSIAPPGHPLNPDRSGIYSGFNMGCNGDGVTSMKPGQCRGDHGDRKPSDKNDKKPGVDVNSNKTADVNTSTSPISNGAGYQTGSSQWIQNLHDKKNEGDAGRGRETGEGGGSGGSPNSGDGGGGDQGLTQDTLDNMPDADEVEADYKCVVRVAGFPSKSAGVIGGREVCVPAGPSFVQKYAFDSEEAASNLCAGLLGRPSCHGSPPCEQTCIASCGITCKGDPSKAGDGSLIGYTPDPGGSAPVIL
jgi:hypothetical protein